MRNGRNHVASAQGPDFLATFSQPERTLSTSGGTVLQGLFPNEIAQINWSTSTCATFSAEKWTPRTAFHTMAGDEDADGVYWNPTIFGEIDALLSIPNPTTTVGGTNQRTVFYSPSTAMGNMRRTDEVSEATGNGSDFDGDAVLVPAATRTHGVRQLGGTTARAETAGRRTQLPGAGAVAAGLRLRLLLLGNCHSDRLLVTALRG